SPLPRWNSHKPNDKVHPSSPLHSFNFFLIDLINRSLISCCRDSVDSSPSVSLQRPPPSEHMRTRIG
ncbi:hypothetical protein LINPERPRIM_LOCUS35528, partial [Linum perenne]